MSQSNFSFPRQNYKVYGGFQILCVSIGGNMGTYPFLLWKLISCRIFNHSFWSFDSRCVITRSSLAENFKSFDHVVLEGDVILVEHQRGNGATRANLRERWGEIERMKGGGKWPVIRRMRKEVLKSWGEIKSEKKREGWRWKGWD